MVTTFSPNALLHASEQPDGGASGCSFSATRLVVVPPVSTVGVRAVVLLVPPVVRAVGVVMVVIVAARRVRVRVVVRPVVAVVMMIVPSMMPAGLLDQGLA